MVFVLLLYASLLKCLSLQRVDQDYKQEALQRALGSFQTNYRIVISLAALGAQGGTGKVSWGKL